METVNRWKIDQKYWAEKNACGFVHFSIIVMIQRCFILSRRRPQHSHISTLKILLENGHYLLNSIFKI